jgi:DeoR family transcriptional regulator, fructose operon transcriptional repressor
LPLDDRYNSDTRSVNNGQEAVMLPSQRRQAILAAVRAEDAASADALARQFDVSVETIRRDLRALHSEGLLERVYGGATRPAGRSDEGSFAARSRRNVELKRAIAALAVTLIEPDDTIVLDVGTTALEVARALPPAFRGRVLTNSVPVAMALSGRPDIDQLLCGGQVRPGDGACSGAHAEAFFDEFYADKAFLGSGGVHATAGLTDYYPPEVVVRRTIIAHTAASYVLADSSKLGTIAVHRVCALDSITAVVTDDRNPGAVSELQAAGVTLLCAASTSTMSLSVAG